MNDEELIKHLRNELSKEKSKATSVINLLSVMAPIDWSYVFSAPGNNQQNADRIRKAVEWVEIEFCKK